MKIKGKCPMGCGETLFLGEGGYVTCGFLRCPDPNAVSVMMDQLDKLTKMLRSSDGIEQV